MFALKVHADTQRWADRLVGRLCGSVDNLSDKATKAIDQFSEGTIMLTWKTKTKKEQK